MVVALLVERLFVDGDVGRKLREEERKSSNFPKSVTRYIATKELPGNQIENDFHTEVQTRFPRFDSVSLVYK